MTKDRRRVVVTGMGCYTPLGENLCETFANFDSDASPFKEVTSYNASESAVRFTGQCSDPNIKMLPNRKHSKALRRKDIIGLLAMIEAWTNSGLAKEDYDPERSGVYVGAPATQVGDLTPYFHLVGRCFDSDSGSFDSGIFGSELMNLVNPLVVLQNLMNNGLAYSSMSLDLRGVNANFMDLQISGMRAIGEGFRAIQNNYAEVVLAGGVAPPAEPFHVAEGVSSGYLAKTSQLSETPEEIFRPYDKKRCGTILSDGAAYLVLEEYEHAISRGATVFAEITGFGLASDGAADNPQNKISNGSVRSIEQAIQASSIETQELSFIVGQGNSCQDHDAIEACSLLKAIGPLVKEIPLSTAKPRLGEMMEAGSAMSILFAIKCMQEKKLPAVRNFQSADQFTECLSLSSEARELDNSSDALVLARSILGLSSALTLRTL